MRFRLISKVRTSNSGAAAEAFISQNDSRVSLTGAVGVSLGSNDDVHVALEPTSGSEPTSRWHPAAVLRHQPGQRTWVRADGISKTFGQGGHRGARPARRLDRGRARPGGRPPRAQRLRQVDADQARAGRRAGVGTDLLRRSAGRRRWQRPHRRSQNVQIACEIGPTNCSATSGSSAVQRAGEPAVAGAGRPRRSVDPWPAHDHGYLRDCSLHGVFLITSEWIRANEAMDVRIELPGSESARRRRSCGAWSRTTATRCSWLRKLGASRSPARTCCAGPRDRLRHGADEWSRTNASTRKCSRSRPEVAGGIRSGCVRANRSNGSMWSSPIRS